MALFGFVWLCFFGQKSPFHIGKIRRFFHFKNGFVSQFYVFPACLPLDIDTTPTVRQSRSVWRVRSLQRRFRLQPNLSDPPAASAPTGWFLSLIHISEPTR